MVDALPVSHIFIRADARKLNPGAVDALVASIEEVGIINPLRVRPARRNVGGVLADAWEVTAGAHRLQAALKIGMETVPCVVVNDDDLHAELAMIDENLCRAELGEAEKSIQTDRRKKIYEELHPEASYEARPGRAGKSRQVGDNSEPAERFTEATAKVIGISERAVQRIAERGDKIAPDVLERVRGTHLDKGTYLDALKKLPHDQQRAKVDRALAEPAPKLKQPRSQPKDEAEISADWRIAFERLWNKAPSAEDREWAKDWVDGPVMDRRRA